MTLITGFFFTIAGMPGIKLGILKFSSASHVREPVIFKVFLTSARTGSSGGYDCHKWSVEGHIKYGIHLARILSNKPNLDQQSRRFS